MEFDEEQFNSEFNKRCVHLINHPSRDSIKARIKARLESFDFQAFEHVTTIVDARHRQMAYEVYQHSCYIEPTHLIHLLVGIEHCVMTVRFEAPTFSHLVCPKTQQEMMNDKGSYHQSFHFDAKCAKDQVELYRQMAVPLLITLEHYVRDSDGSTLVHVEKGNVTQEICFKKKISQYKMLEFYTFRTTQDWMQLSGLSTEAFILRELAETQLHKVKVQIKY